MDNKRFGAFTSSTDPNKMSMTVQALLGAVASIVVLFFGDVIPLSEAQVTETVGQLGIAISAVLTLVGIFRKGTAKLGRALSKYNI